MYTARLKTDLKFYLSKTCTFLILTKNLTCIVSSCSSLQKFVSEFAECADILTSFDPVGVGSDEMFFGRSGYIAGCLWLRRQLGREIISEEKMFLLCDIMVESGRRFSRCDYKG